MIGGAAANQKQQRLVGGGNGASAITSTSFSRSVQGEVKLISFLSSSSYVNEMGSEDKLSEKTSHESSSKPGSKAASFKLHGRVSAFLYCWVAV